MRKPIWLWILWSVLVTACSVMPKPVKQAALPDMPFPELVAQAGQFIGKTVILGGYVLETDNLEHETRMVAVQAPLDFGQKPKSKDLSKGRLILNFKGFLDPEVYAKDRVITVAGQLKGSSATQSARLNYPYVEIDVTHLHLWAEEIPLPRDPYWDSWYWGPSVYPYPWGWRHPFYR